MEKMLHVSSSPHVRDGVTTPVLMYDVIIAMLPAAAFGVYHFGFHALLVLLSQRRPACSANTSMNGLWESR